MGTQSRIEVQLNGEQKVKAYGLIVYGAMTTLAGGVLAERRHAFILVAALGLIALIIGLITLARRTASDHLRKNMR